jgi:hypothetical protein
MPENRTKVFRKPIFGLLLELLLVIDDIVSYEGPRIDHPCSLLECNIRFLAENWEGKELIGKKILFFVISYLPKYKILLFRLQLKLQNTNLLTLISSRKSSHYLSALFVWIHLDHHQPQYIIAKVLVIELFMLLMHRNVDLCDWLRINEKASNPIGHLLLWKCFEKIGVVLQEFTKRNHLEITLQFLLANPKYPLLIDVAEFWW